jgi:cardiolipin synthase A/B
MSWLGTKRGPLAWSCSACASLAAALLAPACSSNAGSGSDSGTPVYIPNFDSGTGHGEGGLVHRDGGSGYVYPDTGTGQHDVATTQGDTGGTPPSSGSGSSPPIPSSGIAITVIPDGTGIAQGLLTAMENAHAAVHIEMYLLTNQTYINEIITLSHTLDVKVILNQTFPTGTSASDTNGSSSSGTFATLSSAGVHVVWAPSTFQFTHEKTVIIDPGQTGEQAWIMTMNLDTDAPKDNREYLAQDTNSADIAEAEDIFEADYAGTSITASGNLVVAPQPPNNCATVLLGLVNSATTSIDMEAEEIDESGSDTETKIFDALTAKAKSGVTVRLVLEDSDESTQTTAVNDLIAAGGQVRGYAYGGNALDIHAKALVVDGTSAYVGSENFTGGSLGYNRELGVYFNEASQVTLVDTTIIGDFNAGSTYTPSSG